MKKLSLILLSFLLLLGGCNPYPRDETLESYGYDLKDNGVYVFEVSDNDRLSTILDSNTEQEIGIGASIETEDRSYIDLSYNYNTLIWGAKYNGDIDLSPKDVYAYMEKEIPLMATELVKLAEYKNVPMDELNGGNESNIDMVIYDNLRIINPVVINGDAANKKVLLDGEYYLQVNFDVVNNTTKNVKLSELNVWMCYATSNSSGKCNNLGTLKTNVLNSADNNFSPGDKVSVQYTINVVDGGHDFNIGINDNNARSVSNIAGPINEE